MIKRKQRDLFIELLNSFVSQHKFGMSKPRISHCNKENVKVLQALKNRVELLKQNPVGLSKNRSSGVQNQVFIKNAVAQHRVPAKLSQHHTPKNLLGLKGEASYAAVPARQESLLVQFAIRKEAEDFRKVPKKNIKTKIATVNWYNGSSDETKKIDQNKRDENL